MIIKAPLEHYYDKIGYNPNEIADVKIGAKYLACHLKNGKLGVCATLGQEFPSDFSYSKTPNLRWICDRILLNAWFNAKLNNSRNYPEDKDIFDFLSFDQYERIVMVGYFASLVRKFKEAKIELNIFDLCEDSPDIIPMSKQKEYIHKADALILTSTSISNASFEHLIDASGKNTEIFLLGPSTILDPDMYKYPNIKKIFGMVFQGTENEVVEMIAEDHGTPSFSKLAHKVYM